jgi:predicted ATP-grasp superfamily ATP-dependent carboligase
MQEKTQINLLVLASNRNYAENAFWCLHFGGYRKIHVLAPHCVYQSPVVRVLSERFHLLPDNIRFDEADISIKRYIEKIALTATIKAIIPSDYQSQQFLSHHKITQVGDARVIPMPDKRLSNSLHNKADFAKFCLDKSIPHPRTVYIDSPSQLSHSAEKVGFPLLIKPLNESSGRGIIKVNTIKGLTHLLDQKTSMSLPSQYILQQHIDGSDIDFSAYAINGNIHAYTIQKEIEGPTFSNRSARWISFIDHQKVYDIASSIIRYSSYSGPVHVDLREDGKDGNVFAIEANPRFWGSMVASLCNNVNFIDIGIKLLENTSLKITPAGMGKIWGDPAILIRRFMLMRRGSLKYFGRDYRHTQYRIWFYRNIIKIIDFLTLKKDRLCKTIG